MTFVGGALVNKLGIKWSCIIAALAMPLAGSGYYVTVNYPGHAGQAYLLAARVSPIRI